MSAQQAAAQIFRRYTKAFRAPPELRTNRIISLIKMSALLYTYMRTSFPSRLESLRPYSKRLYSSKLDADAKGILIDTNEPTHWYTSNADIRMNNACRMRLVNEINVLRSK